MSWCHDVRLGWQVSISPAFAHVVVIPTDSRLPFGVDADKAQAIRNLVAECWPDAIEADWRLKGDWRLRWGGDFYEVSFQDRNKALLFKLAWGGK